jgi:hypothetical protein
MPFVVEQIIEQNTPEINSNQSNETIGKDPFFVVVLVSAMMLYLFRGFVFTILKFGFFAFLGFSLLKLI